MKKLLALLLLTTVSIGAYPVLPDCFPDCPEPVEWCYLKWTQVCFDLPFPLGQVCVLVPYESCEPIK